MEHQESYQCRVCLEDGAIVPIFETKVSLDPEVYRKLCQCVGETLEDLHGYPRHICHLCHITLNTATRFIEQYKQSQEILSRHLNTKIKLEIDNCSDPISEADCDLYEDNTDLVVNEPKKESVDDSVPEQRRNCKLTCKAKLRSTKKNTKLVANHVSNDNKSPESSRKKNMRKRLRLSCTTKPVENKEKSRPALKRISNEQPKPTCLCEQCGAIFEDKNKLQMHIKREHKNMMCQFCPGPKKHRYSQHSLRDHIKITHSKLRPYMCSICGKAFKLKKTLNNHHTVVHLGKKRKNQRKVCKLCKRDFANKLCLEMHMATHTGERPEECKECGKTFAHKQYLTQHMRLHTGEKPFKCPVCNQGYAQACNMKSHIKHNHRVSQLSEAMLETLTKSKNNYLRFMNP